jgi:hypothetical protein
MRTLLTLALLAVLAVFGGALAVNLGAYNVAATEPHWRPTFWVLDFAMQRSVSKRARAITPRHSATPRSCSEASRFTTRTACNVMVRREWPLSRSRLG